MAHVISLATSKGGTGKTTTALNLAVAFAEMGRRTALVDLDPQGAIGLSLARGDGEWAGLADHLRGKQELAEVVLQTKVPTLSILPRGRLDAVDVCDYELLLRDRENLGRVVEALSAEQEYVILDNPSGLGMITRAALAASDFVLVPLQAEPIALRAFAQVLRVVDHVQREENPHLKLLGILLTMVQLHQETSLNVMGTVWSQLGGVLDTSIPRAEVFSRASELGLPVSFLAGRTPPEARRFTLLARELETLIEDLTGRQEGADASMHRQLV